MNQYPRTGDYIYTYAYTPDEESLCYLEMRSLFGNDTQTKVIKSTYDINPSRSPFIKERIEVLFEGNELSDILKQVEVVHMGELTFKVLFVKINDLASTEKVEYKQKREIEREIGLIIEGEADVHRPDVTFGLVPFKGNGTLVCMRKTKLFGCIIKRSLKNIQLL